MTMKYAVVIERAPRNYSAYVPDLPGCISTGATEDEALRRIQEAIEFHLDGLRADGLPIPGPSAPSPSSRLSSVARPERPPPLG